MRNMLLTFFLFASGCGILGGLSDPEQCVDPPVELCDRLGKDCGVLQAVDACDRNVIVSCGECEAPQSCGGAGQVNVCGCVAESDRAICERTLKNCGGFTATDNCGQTRNVTCGVCTNAEICGEELDNVCGCPCRIDGSCYAEGQSNPLNRCEVCDPSAATDAWTALAPGDSCDDGDPCTEGEQCTAQNRCVGTAKVCATDEVCQTAFCSPVDGECISEPIEDGISCEADGVSCTTGTCSSGSCVEDQVADFCVIDDACYRDLDRNPLNDCQSCDANSSPDGWVANADGSTCDGVFAACETGRCALGVCSASLIPNRCKIDNVCYVAGDSNPINPCEICDPTQSTSAWSSDEGRACDDMDGFACTQGVCEIGVCEPKIVDRFCLIDGACYGPRERLSTTSCEVCLSYVSQTSWTAQTPNSVCNTNNNCRCGAGNQCRTNNGAGGLCTAFP